jgi:hypothetical protein
MPQTVKTPNRSNQLRATQLTEEKACVINLGAKPPSLIFGKVGCYNLFRRDRARVKRK